MCKVIKNSTDVQLIFFIVITQVDTKIAKTVESLHSFVIDIMSNTESLRFHSVFVGYGKFLPSLSSACGKYSASVGRRHSFSESVFVFTLSIRRLKCPLHKFTYILNS